MEILHADYKKGAKRMVLVTIPPSGQDCQWTNQLQALKAFKARSLPKARSIIGAG